MVEENRGWGNRGGGKTGARTQAEGKLACDGSYLGGFGPRDGGCQGRDCPTGCCCHQKIQKVQIDIGLHIMRCHALIKYTCNNSERSTLTYVNTYLCKESMLMSLQGQDDIWHLALSVC